MLKRGLRVLKGGRAERAVRPKPDWRAALAAREGAYASTTLAAAERDFLAYEQWCDARGETALPAHAETLAAFIEDASMKWAMLTIRRRIHVIHRMHQWLKLPDPTDSELVILALRRATRRAAKPPRQALGLSAHLRDQLLAACPDTLLGLRDQAMISVGYDSLCRRSELVALTFEDVRGLPDGAAKILVRTAKNDPAGEGRFAYISAATYGTLQAWLKASQIKDGPLFRSIHGAVIGDEPMNPRIVNRTLKLAAERAGLSPEIANKLSGHSMRVGAAQDLAIAGRSVLQIMRAGRWYSLNGMMGYVRKADVNVWGAFGDTRSVVDQIDAP